MTTFFLLVCNFVCIYALFKLYEIEKELERRTDALDKYMRHQIRFNQRIYGRVEDIEAKEVHQ